MKVALDEHMSRQLVEALQALSGENGLLAVEIVSARDFALPNARSDVPWLERFKAHGGRIVVSGDAKMRGRLHEQRALSDAGFVVFFPARRWNNLTGTTKAGLLFQWWPTILETASKSRPGAFYEIPIAWTVKELREVTPPKRKKPGRKIRTTAGR